MQGIVDPRGIPFLLAYQIAGGVNVGEKYCLLWFY